MNKVLILCTAFLVEFLKNWFKLNSFRFFINCRNTQAFFLYSRTCIFLTVTFLWFLLFGCICHVISSFCVKI